MPHVAVPDDLLLQSLNLVEEYGSGLLAAKAGATDLPRTTVDNRAAIARLKGMKPTVRKDAPRIYERQRIGRMHCVIPDVQMEPGVASDHLTWAGNYIAEKRPDVIVCIGDFFDMPSLSAYDKGKLAFEGRRYVKDVKAGQDAMQKLLKPIEDYNRTAKEKYTPEMHYALGNHEIRIVRTCNEHSELDGKLSLDDLCLPDYGWKVHDFLKVFTIDGVEYAHFFTSGVMGRPVSSAAALLRERQRSATMGHVQFSDMAIHKKTAQRAMFCGCFYQHNPEYLGPQMHGIATRRHLVFKHEVSEGRYDLMEVSLNFLRKAYS